MGEDCGSVSERLVLLGVMSSVSRLVTGAKEQPLHALEVFATAPARIDAEHLDVFAGAGVGAALTVGRCGYPQIRRVAGELRALERLAQEPVRAAMVPDAVSHSNSPSARASTVERCCATPPACAHDRAPEIGLRCRVRGQLAIEQASPRGRLPEQPPSLPPPVVAYREHLSMVQGELVVPRRLVTIWPHNATQAIAEDGDCRIGAGAGRVKQGNGLERPTERTTRLPGAL